MNKGTRIHAVRFHLVCVSSTVLLSDAFVPQSQRVSFENRRLQLDNIFESSPDSSIVCVPFSLFVITDRLTRCFEFRKKNCSKILKTNREFASTRNTSTLAAPSCLLLSQLVAAELRKTQLQYSPRPDRCAEYDVNTTQWTRSNKIVIKHDVNELHGTTESAAAAAATAGAEATTAASCRQSPSRLPSVQQRILDETITSASETKKEYAKKKRN